MDKDWGQKGKEKTNTNRSEKGEPGVGGVGDGSVTGALPLLLGEALDHTAPAAITGPVPAGNWHKGSKAVSRSKANPSRF